MATSTWYDQAHSSIIKTPVTTSQTNEDWGAMRDAYMISLAQSGMNYELTRALQAASTNDELSLMQASADLDRRNTLDTMQIEQTFKLEGLEAANTLSKDYLAAEGDQTRATMALQGSIDQALQQDALTTSRDIALINSNTEGDVARTNAYATQYTADANLAATGVEAFADRYIADQELAGTGLVTAAQRDVATTQAGADRYIADQQLIGTGLQTEAQKDIANTQAGADRYIADQQLAGTGLQTEAQKDVANTQASADRYIADQQLAGTGLQTEAQKDVANTQAFADRYIADQQRQGAENVANISGRWGLAGVREQEAAETERTGMTLSSQERQIGLTGDQNVRGIREQGFVDYQLQGLRNQGARDIANIEGSTARDVENIRGGWGLQGIRAQEAGATNRTGMQLASAERQIGLAGSESRLNIAAEGEQRRQTIATEGDQARQNIRTQGDEQRRNLTWDRDDAANRAVRFSRRR